MMENAKRAFPTFPPHGGGWMFAIRIMINPFGSIESMGDGRPSLTIESDQRVMTKVPVLYPPWPFTRCSNTGQEIPALDKTFDLIEGAPVLLQLGFARTHTLPGLSSQGGFSVA